MKKKTEPINAIDTNRIIHVDLGRLSQGLALTFSGVTAVFESLGADEVPGFGTVSAVEGETGEESADVPSEASEPEKKEATKKKADKVGNEAREGTAVATAVNKVSETEPSKPATVEAEASVAEPENTEAPTETSTESPAAGGSAFTLNDIMKIAAQKMARDAKVTEKIGALVKTYGVATLKELPEEKFEAFMTDLTQI